MRCADNRCPCDEYCECLCVVCRLFGFHLWFVVKNKKESSLFSFFFSFLFFFFFLFSFLNLILRHNSHRFIKLKKAVPPQTKLLPNSPHQVPLSSLPPPLLQNRHRSHFPYFSSFFVVFFLWLFFFFLWLIYENRFVDVNGC